MKQDLSNSFGFKTDEYGLSYSINFDYNEKINISTGLSYKKSDRHSAKKDISSINDNIGEYDIYTLSSSIRQDSTNDFYILPMEQLIVYPLNIHPKIYLMTVIISL